MYDLHTHSSLTDGELIPIELVRRMAVLGYSTVAITDHADPANLHFLISAVRKVKDAAGLYGVKLLCGVELTHIPPAMIASCAREARTCGADIVVVHGETTVEPVAEGTNTAACTCTDVDILAHPGLITVEDAEAAREFGVALEITSRGGHNRTNGHIVTVAREAGCSLVVNSDAHGPRDLLDERAKFLVARGAGLKKEECARVLALNTNSLRLRGI
ncbi:MAG: histidinol phosphate phosphatase domain-containing protein [Methanomicrobiales archaeon]|nr:histidinol phosphate phosphatase domain-containing protein [Methanomicrobiales archaeon]NYT20257.1 histidinol phosphate phosphatase domain-containing protein [Methanomicrobiales archaeon]